MFVSGRIIARAVNVMNATGILHRLRQGLTPKCATLTRPTMYTSRCMCSKSDDRFPDDTNDKNKDNEEPNSETNYEEVSPHLRDKFLLFEDRDSEVILDIHEEFQQMLDENESFEENRISPQEKKRAEHNFERGQTGVYDIEDLVSVLEAENAMNICVIQMPPELRYADFMVIASARSARHIAAMMEYVRKLYKKKMNKSDKVANIQGANSKTWLALDMGNIVLHLMLPEERSKYDIETLWAVGEKYDDNSVKPQDTVANTLQTHLKFLESWRPLREEKTI